MLVNASFTDDDRPERHRLHFGGDIEIADGVLSCGGLPWHEPQIVSFIGNVLTLRAKRFITGVKSDKMSTLEIAFTLSSRAYANWNRGAIEYRNSSMPWILKMIPELRDKQCRYDRINHTVEILP